jgi:hypothetical protein
MKCSPFNIKKILDSSHEYGDQYLFDLGDEHSTFISSVEKLKGKRYKLYFLLNCFAEMAQSIGESKKDIELDEDGIQGDEEASGYWRDVYDDLFDSDRFNDEFSDHVDPDEAASWLYEQIESRDIELCTEKDNIESVLECVSNINLIKEILDVLASNKNIEKFGPFNLKDKFREEYGQVRGVISQNKIDKAVENSCTMVFHFFITNFNKIHGGRYASDVLQILEDKYEDKVKEEWFEENKENFLRDHIDSQIDSYLGELGHVDRKLGEKLFGRVDDDGQRHYVDPGIMKRLKDAGDWGLIREDGKVNFNYDEKISKLGIGDWLEIEEAFKERAPIKTDDTFIEVIVNYSFIIKNTINSDPDLKYVFSDDNSPMADFSGNLEFLENSVAITDSILSGMPNQYGIKMMRDLNLSESRSSDERVSERIRILREEKQKQREEEERKKQEIKRQQRIHQEFQDNLSQDPSFKKQVFEESNAEKAKSEGIINKPFLHTSIMRFDSYPGSAPFNGQQLPYSVYSTPFHIAVHPKIKDSDPELMKNVFRSDSGLNYHMHSFMKYDHEDPQSTRPQGHYDIIGWIGGDIDLYNKIMYVNEIQSDIMQNTPRMKDVFRSKENLEKESDKIRKEISQLQSSMELSHYEYYAVKIKELKEKIKSSNDQSFINKTLDAIRSIESKQNNNINPYENTQKKIFNLKKNLEEIDYQLEGLKESQKNPGLNRENLAPFKSLVENRFQDWIDSFYNATFKYCNQIGIKKLFLVSADYLSFVWSRYMGEETMSLYKKIYDRQAEKYNMKKEKFNGKSWWILDLGQNKPKFASSWYRLQKFADQDFSSIDISDLIEKFTSGQIDRSELENQIKERYNRHVSSNAINPNKTFVIELTAFFEHFMQSLHQQDEESFRDHDSFREIEKIKETISNFMSTTGKKYTDEMGELKEPFHSIMHRFLIQKYNYDIELDELV